MVNLFRNGFYLFLGNSWAFWESKLIKRLNNNFQLCPGYWISRTLIATIHSQHVRFTKCVILSPSRSRGRPTCETTHTHTHTLGGKKRSGAPPPWKTNDASSISQKLCPTLSLNNNAWDDAKKTVAFLWFRMSMSPNSLNCRGGLETTTQEDAHRTWAGTVFVHLFTTKDGAKERVTFSLRLTRLTRPQHWGCV